MFPEPPINDEIRQPITDDSCGDFDNHYGTFPGTRWKHYKGETYQLVTTAWHTENKEVMVVYQHPISRRVFTRPGFMFVEMVNGQRRFTKVG